MSKTLGIKSVVLDTADISNFTLLGNQAPATAPTTLSFSDADVGNVSALFAPDPHAVSGIDLDLVATFQVRSVTPNNADGCFRLVINDGVTRSAIVACAIVNGQRSIALVTVGSPSEPTTYPVSAVVDWLVAPVSLRLRRWADGRAELMELNGARPSPRVFLSPDLVAGRTRAGSSAEFGCMSLEGLADVDVTEFYTETVGAPVPSVPALGAGLRTLLTGLLYVTGRHALRRRSSMATPAEDGC